MEDQILSYKCPCCSAPLKYGGRSNKLTCKSCGNSYDLEVLTQAEDILHSAEQKTSARWESTRSAAWSEGETEHLEGYNCPSCGAQIMVDNTTAATECVYCGNVAIMPGVVSGDFKPDAVLPFIKTKGEAIEAYQELIHGKRLLPKSFARKKHIDKITGVYVPFWLFESDVDADITFRTERTTQYTSGDDDVIDTDHFLVQRGGTIGFAGVPADGSTKFDDTLMEAIEPFHYDKEVAFSTDYLPGYQAQRYDVPSEEVQPRAEERIRQSVIDAFSREVVGYTSVAMQSASVRLLQGKVRNVMVPVWMLNTKWQDKTYTFAMNGQTGKLVGDLPIDKRAAWKWRAGLFLGNVVGLTLIAALLVYLGVL